MAIIRCSECRKDLSSTAEACPHCGAPIAVASKVAKTSGTQVLKWVGGLVLVLIALRMCGSAMNSDAIRISGKPEPAPAEARGIAGDESVDSAQLSEWLKIAQNGSDSAQRRLGHANAIIKAAPASREAKVARELLPKLTADVEEARSLGDWVYSSDEDPMSGQKAFHAYVFSENTLNLEFPYQGAQRGKLTIRKHPKWGNDVYVSIEKGQILCHSYDCSISIRFDEGQPVTLTGTEPGDNSTETVFLPYSVERKIRTARQVRIQLTLFHNGAQVLEFNVKGFKPERMKG